MQIPYFYTYTLYTTLSIKEIRAKLVANSDPGWKPRKASPPAHLSLEERHAPQLDDGSLRRYQQLEVLDWGAGGAMYPNCFLKAEDQGTYCRVKLKFRPFVLYSIFMAIWTTGMLFGSISVTIETLLHRPLKEMLFLVIFIPFYAGFWLFHRVTYSSLLPKYLTRMRGVLSAVEPTGRGR